MFMNGEFVASQSAKTFPVYDPSTEEVIAQVPDAGANDVDPRAAAKEAFEEGPWSRSTAQERGRVLFRLADIVRQKADTLAELEARNSGKPITEAEFDIADVATCFEYYGGLCDQGRRPGLSRSRQSLEPCPRRTGMASPDGSFPGTIHC